MSLLNHFADWWQWYWWAIVFIVASGGSYFVLRIYFGETVARYVMWGILTGGLAFVLRTRTFQQAQEYERVKAERTNAKAIDKANKARADSERQSDSGKLRDDDGHRRD